jgi:hypothetical protein
MCSTWSNRQLAALFAFGDIEYIEPYRPHGLAWIEHNHVITAVIWHARQYIMYQVTAGIDDHQSRTGPHILDNKVSKQGGFADAGRPSHPHVAQAIICP